MAAFASNYPQSDFPPCPAPPVPNGPAPVPAPGTANVALCNFLNKATVFKVCGMQGSTLVTKEISVPAYSYLWSPGWGAGSDKMLLVTTSYFSKHFTPFVTSDLVVIFQQ